MSSVALLPEAPRETGRTGPLWRVDFADREKTSFYLSPATAEVVTRRSGVWRLFDFFWRLHVMDWNDGEDFNHPLIIITTALTLSIVVSGFILLWICSNGCGSAPAWAPGSPLRQGRRRSSFASTALSLVTEAR
ncbi:PepSY domain-containing protein [Brevundimonas mediterranea]|uniref:Putative iron-regulated membrane protein n=1 Tax=Brevundimonas mediterranea TaxID=74329 RepID=A0A7W6F0L4_9CAUL|nr:putative iron-regulated membrane protein [Brevundimonas mediterranea]